MEDDVLLFCEKQEVTDYTQLVERFGAPADVAAGFFAEADPKAASHFAYTRLKTAYLLLTAVIVAALSIVTVSAIDYAHTQHLVATSRDAEIFVHPDGTECTSFKVRTNYRGNDVYWEYSSCIGGLWLTSPPEDSDGTEPYAVDIYLNDDGTIEHWTFGQEHLAWIRVYDE